MKKFKQKFLVSAILIGFASSGALAFKPNNPAYGHQMILETILSKNGYYYNNGNYNVPRYEYMGNVLFSDEAIEHIVVGGNTRDWFILKNDTERKFFDADKATCYESDLSSSLLEGFSNICLYDQWNDPVYITGDLYRADAHFDNDGFTKSADAIYNLIRGNPELIKVNPQWEIDAKSSHDSNKVSYAGVGVLKLLKEYVVELNEVNRLTDEVEESYFYKNSGISPASDVVLDFFVSYPKLDAIGKRKTELRKMKKVARIKLGKALHTLHDFYAHSNWADLHLDQKDELFTPITDNLMNVDGSKPIFPKNLLASGEEGDGNRVNGNMCIIEKFGGNWDMSILKDNIIITTGAFSSALSGGNSISGIGFASDTEGASRCDHGSFFGDPALGTNGIAKDGPTWPPRPITSGTEEVPSKNHLVASYQAAKHSKILLDKVIEIIKKTYPEYSDSMISALLGHDELPARVALVVDGTGSMSHIIPGIIEGIKTTANSNGMTVVTFNEKGELGIVHDDLQKMQTLLGNIGKGGGGCRVPSYQTLQNVIDLLPPKSSIYFITDATPSDKSDLQGIINSAKKRKIKINPIIMGGCNIDVDSSESYENLAKGTEGLRQKVLPDSNPIKSWLTGMLKKEATSQVRSANRPSGGVATRAAGMSMLTSVAADPILIEIGNVNSNKTVNIPVDAGLMQVLVTVAATNIQASLTNAAGESIPLIDSGSGVLFAAVSNPVAGMWKLVINATTATPYQVQVEAQGGVSLKNLDYSGLLEVGPRSGHEYGVMLGSTPPSGKSKASLRIEGAAGNIVTLSYVREDGSLIASYPLNRASSVAFTGTVTVPASAYWVRVSGTSADGGEFIRTWRGEHPLPTPMPSGWIMVNVPEGITFNAGSNGIFSVGLSNVGADENLTLSANSSIGPVTVMPNTLTLPANTASKVDFNLAIPTSAIATGNLVLTITSSIGVRDVTIPIKIRTAQQNLGAITIAPVMNAVQGGSVTSSAITVSGLIAETAPISITNGEYQVNGGVWTSVTGTVKNGDTVKVRLIASPTPGAVVRATLSIDTQSGSFTVTTAMEDGTVADPKTGLMWKRCMEGQTWSNGTCIGTPSTYTFAQANALTGAVTFAGQSDWRVPSIRELTTIVDYTLANPAIDLNAFPNTYGTFVRSSSSNPYNANCPWSVSFFGGISNDCLSNHIDSMGVRLVRGGTSSSNLLNLARPNSDYQDNGDGTATHKPTGLMWKRCLEGQTWSGSTCTGIANVFTWRDAKTIVSTFANKNDWRLPTQQELLSLVDYTKPASTPTLNTGLFPNDPASGVWSGSPYAYDAGFAWFVHFSYGYSNEYIQGNIQSNLSRNGFGVRLVRGDQSSVLLPPTDINCFLNWAEMQSPELLNPPKQTTKLLPNTAISYRGYSTGVYLGVDGSSNAVLATGDVFGWELKDLGSLNDFLPNARSASCK